MADMSLWQSGRPFTVQDLAMMPDDGRRYELIDGMLTVSPIPGLRHQKVVMRLAAILIAASPDEFEVLNRFAVQPGVDTELQPDVVVGHFADFTEDNLPTAPVLAVEVLEPSTALYDAHTKKVVYARMGTPSYWLIDPIEVTLTVYELDPDGSYREAARVQQGEVYEAKQPFPLEVVPRDLLGRFAAR